MCRGTRFEALEPLHQGVRHSFRTIGPDAPRGLTLRHDHGSQGIIDDFQNEIRLLGIEDSPSYVREPRGNGIAERFVRILKENLLWVRRFRTVEELHQALLAFKETYNTRWRVGRHGYKTPGPGPGETAGGVGRGGVSFNGLLRHRASLSQSDGGAP